MAQILPLVIQCTNGRYGPLLNLHSPGLSFCHIKTGAQLTVSAVGDVDLLVLRARPPRADFPYFSVAEPADRTDVDVWTIP